MFGEYLISNNLITREQLDESLGVQELSRQKIGRVLVTLGHLTQTQLNEFLAKFLKISCEDSILKHLEKPDQKVQVIEFDKNVFGYLCSGSFLFLKEFKDEYIAKIEANNRFIGIRLISEDQERVLKSVSRSDKEQIVVPVNREKAGFSDGIGPFDKFFISMLEKARNHNASDIHFDVEERGLIVRMRINGDLEEVSCVDKAHIQPVMTKVRSEVGLPLSVVGRPCSGSKYFEKFKIKVRSEYAPETLGETIVCRIIDSSKIKNANIENLGADRVFTEPLLRSMNKKNGLILLCGQTGSGKSLTLFSVLMSMDRTRKKIISIEDPVEYEGEGISQIDVNKHSITFGEALRSSLRLDPDIIMVGEIRDEETAHLAMRAASTGHLVFSTLHTNSALGAITRLTGMGIAHDVLAENLEVVSALTLRKKLCPFCKQPVAELNDPEVREEFSGLVHLGVELFEQNSQGCENPDCFKGVIGRQIITETINGEIIKSKIMGRITPGYRSLKDCVKEYACAGVISPYDVVGV
ncbi:MAG: Flp pilus assembly complex ATPase component TadA [Bdellovibrionales bacterium]|nr:Flp pilus assembly complex ATPase component TadA [Bdellovibrionales bacterium]